MNNEDLDRLKDIRSEMLDLLEEANTILRHEGGSTYARAKAYPLAHIGAALASDEYHNPYDTTLLTIIKECNDPDDETTGPCEYCGAGAGEPCHGTDH